MPSVRGCRAFRLRLAPLAAALAASAHVLRHATIYTHPSGFLHSASPYGKSWSMVESYHRFLRYIGRHSPDNGLLSSHLPFPAHSIPHIGDRRRKRPRGPPPQDMGDVPIQPHNHSLCMYAACCMPSALMSEAVEFGGCRRAAILHGVINAFRNPMFRS